MNSATYLRNYKVIMNNQQVNEQKLRENVRLAFDYFDADRSGFLDKREVRNLLKAVEKSLKDPQFVVTDHLVDKLFKTLDSDGNNQVSFDEIYGVIRAILAGK